MNKSFSVSGTPEEWQVLINLLDVAVKSAGTPAAKAVVVWTERIQKAAEDSVNPMKQAEVPLVDSQSVAERLGLTA